MDPVAARLLSSVTLERTVRELRGESCLALEVEPVPRQQIACTRSFGQPVADLAPLVEAVSTFTHQAAMRLRAQHSLAGAVLVFVRTSPFRRPPQYSRSVVIPLTQPTQDTARLLRATLQGLRDIHRPGIEIMKAGVMLLDLQAAALQQLELDTGHASDTVQTDSRRMAAMDTINALWGKGTLHPASVSREHHDWQPRQGRLSPCYTTRWSDMPVVRA